MNTLRAHEMTTHELTQNTAGQSQPRDSHCDMTAANAMDCTNAKQNANTRPEHWPTLTKNATDQTTSWPQLCTFTDYITNAT